LECEVSVADDRFAEMCDAARFDFGVVPHGYGWVFPKGSHLSIGVLTTHRGRTGLGTYLQQYLAVHGLQRARKIERHGYVIPLRPTGRPFMRNRTLLVGDAAGFADPITAEGISFAILSGQLAGRAIVDGHLDVERVRRLYDVLLRKRILRELFVARPFAHVLYEQSPGREWLLGRHARGVAEALTEVLSGNSTYMALFSAQHLWRFVTRSARRSFSADERRAS
jgi:flavin-dependent dehydrogenase